MKVLVTGARGAPGVTTVAFGLAAGLAFEATTFLVEADAAGGSLTADLGLGPSNGLLELVAARDVGERSLGTALSPSLRLIGGPASRGQAAVALRSAEQRILELPGNVVLDVGRGAGPSPVASSSGIDLVVHVVRPVVSQLAALVCKWRDESRPGTEVAALVTGASKVTGAVPVTEAMDLLRAHASTFELPWDPSAVRSLHEAPQGRRWTSRPFGCAITALLSVASSEVNEARARW